MFLEMHDDQPPTLCATARNLDYVYQAEQHIIDTAKEEPRLVAWVLFSDAGQPIKAWRRSGDGFEEHPVAPDTRPDPRSLQPRKAP